MSCNVEDIFTKSNRMKVNNWIVLFNALISPDHALAMSVKTSDALCAEELSDRVNAYLKGEELSAQSAGRGYCLCTYMGFPLGLGKASGGALKNRLPKGLRKF